ncbi:MAG TPA: pyrroline-5-carboxylate reductase [Acidimicrobiia bacterium]|nr:pyrroline-5-carboxylate reductase [Acidimicrobiia bacterium]
MQPSVAILGAGAMGEVLAGGLLRAGWPADSLRLAARREERRADVEQRTGVRTTLDAAECAAAADVVVVAVKPSDVPRLLDQIGGAITTEQVVVSLAAGVPTSVFEAGLADGVAVVRAMPNTPAQIDEGVTAIAAGAHADDHALALAASVLGAVGDTVVLDEHHLDAVTAVSGTGPAYVFLLAEALTEAAAREGIPRHAAERLVAQTIKGAGALLRAVDEGPEKLRAQVTSPGGTTAAAMHVLEGQGFRALIEDAVRAAAARSRELGEKARGDG